MEHSPSLGPLTLVCLALFCSGCSSGPELFVDLAEEQGLEFTAYTGDNIWYLIDSFGAGLAAGDYDGDGWPDLALMTGSAIRSKFQEEAASYGNALWRNQAGRFLDVTGAAGLESHGWSNGAVFADYDGDADLDLFVARHGPNLLYRNDGDGRFTEVGKQAGVDDPRWTTTGCFADFDGDGDLDLYLCNYCDFDIESQRDSVTWFTIKQFPHYFEPADNALLRNNGDGSFTDITASAGPAGVAGTGRSLMVLATDHDNDGDPDILVANDIGLNDLYRNDGNLRFVNEGLESGFACDAEGRFQASMGLAAGDVDSDGDQDLIVSHYGNEYHTLYINDGHGHFSDETYRAGLVNELTMDTVGWGVGFHDLDLDGNLDLLLVSGHVITDFVRRGMLWHWGEDAEKLDDEEYIMGNPQMADQAYNLGADQPKLLFLGQGDGSFRDVSKELGSTFAGRRMSRGAAFADFDRDGRIDVAVSNKNQPAQVLLNRMPRQGNWIKFDLRARAPNHFAVGALVRLRVGDRTQTREIHAGTSYCSSDDYVVHFGLGPLDRVEGVSVRWPDGSEQSFGALGAGDTYRLTQGEAEPSKLQGVSHQEGQQGAQR